MKYIPVVILFILPLMSCQSPNEEQARESGLEIYFEKTTHDYGEIEIDSDGSYAFRFKNIGDKAVIVNRVRSSCGCTIPEWPKEPVEPGKEAVIKVKYNTALEGAFMKTITVYSSAVNSPVKLTIKGKVTETSLSSK